MHSSVVWSLSLVDDHRQDSEFYCSWAKRKDQEREDVPACSCVRSWYERLGHTYFDCQLLGTYEEVPS